MRIADASKNESIPNKPVNIVFTATTADFLTFMLWTIRICFLLNFHKPCWWIRSARQCKAKENSEISFWKSHQRDICVFRRHCSVLVKCNFIKGFKEYRNVVSNYTGICLLLSKTNTTCRES